MASPSQVADAYHARQARLSQVTAVAAVREWRKVDGRALEQSWIAVLVRLLALLTGAQRHAAGTAPGYLAAVLKAQGAVASPENRLIADAFGGVASDGRDLATLLYSPVVTARTAMSQGALVDDALAEAERQMAMLVRTEVADAGRMGTQAAMAGDAAVRGYVRHVSLPACARCIILAGRFYRYSSAFLRHPRCDCTMIPARGEEWVESQDPAGLLAQMRSDHPARLRQSLTEGDLRALDHGADLNQVVNAHRGMATAAGPGRKVSVTTEGTTKRGLAGQRLAKGAFERRPGQRYARSRVVRLTPAQIFDEAGREGWDRAEIVRQLTRAGYLI